MYTLGADPELFLFEGKKPLSVIGKLGGTKNNPVPVKELGNGFAYQEDNVLAEYNIPPASSANQFAEYNLKMIEHLKGKLAEYGQLKAVASAVMPEDQLVDPRAHVFGCEPDFNVWDVQTNPRPTCDDPALRSAGGHLHFGYVMTKAEAIWLGRYCDLWLGLWSVIEDKDVRRRDLYGKAGSVRFKSYGLEYRTLSNYWCTSNLEMKKIFNRATAIIKAFHNRQWDSIIKAHGKDIRMAIDRSDKAQATYLLEKVA